MKLVSLLIIFILIRAEAFAQDPQVSQYMFLKQIVNPGYVGTNQAFCATGAYRTQWVGFEGAPKTFLFCADAPIKALHGGVGIKFINDKIGNFNFTKAGLAYSYQLSLGKTGLLGIGLEGEIVHTVVANNWLTPSGQVIAGNSVNTNYNIDLGTYYKTPQLYIGISSTSILTREYYSFQSFNYRSKRHYYLMAGYDFLFSSWGKAVPSILIKSDAVVTSFDANLTVYWYDFIWTGASYRWRDAIVPMAGFRWTLRPEVTLKFGYAYDIGISDLKYYHNDSHEFLLNCCIGI